MTKNIGAGGENNMKIMISAMVLLLFTLYAWADEYRDVISSTPGLVAHWSFEEQADPRLAEKSKDSNPGSTSLTVESGVFYPGGGTLRTVIRLNDNSGKFSVRTEEVKTGEKGVSGQAFRFNGKDSVVYLFRHPAFESGLDDFSVDLWIKPDSADKLGTIANRRSPFGKGWGEWYLIGSNGKLTFLVRLRQNDQISVSTPPDAVKPGVWQYVAAVRQGNTLLIYMNGELVASDSGRQGLRIPDFGDITLGSNQFGSNYSGLIDEFAYYRQALTQEEIRKHFHAGITQLQK